MQPLASGQYGDARNVFGRGAMPLVLRKSRAPVEIRSRRTTLVWRRPGTITSNDRSTIMAKMLVIYKTPADPATFERHYFDIHLPLAKQLPGLRRYDVSKQPIVNMLQGETPYIVATLYFDSLDAMRAAFASEIGKACAVDRRKYAPDDRVTMLLFDSEAM